MLNDIRYAFRLLRRSPGFAAIAILTLALGIGANTALFSLLDATVLKPLPFRNSNRLVDIREVQFTGTSFQQIVSGMTRERLAEWRAQHHIFEGIEAYKHVRPRQLGQSDVSIGVAPVSPGLFPLLGVSPALGRGFTADEAVGAGAPVVLLTGGLWKRAFGADPAIVGRDIVLAGRRVTVIGVMPKEARYPFSADLDAWVPLTDERDPEDPGWRFVSVVARLRPGLTVSSAQAAVDAAALAIQAARPGGAAWSADLDSIDPRPWLLQSRPLVLVAFGAVIFVLLTACANIANLLLARVAQRRRELAVRAAVGAGRGRIARQLLVECLVLTLLGGAAATLLAWWLIEAIPAALPARSISFPVHEMHLDWRVLLFGAGLSMLVGILSGLVPAVRGARDTPSAPLTSAIGAHATRSHRHARNLLLGAQVAFTLVLLTGAALLSSSLLRMTRAEPGYRLDGLISVDLVLPPSKYPALPQQQAFLSDLLERVSALPGVTAAALGTPPPRDLAGILVAEDREHESELAPSAAILRADTGYFRTLGISLIMGRPFSAEDGAGSAPVAVIDEETARRFWPGQNPLGKRLRYSPHVPWLTVIGVARDVKTSRIAEARDSFELYLPMAQESSLTSATVVVCSTDPDAALPAVMDLLRHSDREVTVRSAGAVADLYDSLMSTARFAAGVMSLFAGLGLLTAAVGLFGILSYAVAQRTSEIGVRMALGADSRDVRWLVVFNALVPVLIGMATGMLMAQWLSRFIEAQLYQVTPRDPLSLVLAVVVFLLVGLAAAWGPGRRATRVDPIVALRAE